MTRRQSYIVGAQCAILLALVIATIVFSKSTVTPNTLTGVWQRPQLIDESALQLHTVQADPHKLSKYIVFRSDGTFETSAGGDVIARGSYRLLDRGRMKLTIDRLEAIYTVQMSGERLSIANELMRYDYSRSELPPTFQ